MIFSVLKFSGQILFLSSDLQAEVCHHRHQIVLAQIRVASQHDMRPDSDFVAPRRGRGGHISAHVPNASLLESHPGIWVFAKNVPVLRSASIDSVDVSDKPLSPVVLRAQDDLTGKFTHRCLYGPCSFDVVLAYLVFALFSGRPP